MSERILHTLLYYISPGENWLIIAKIKQNLQMAHRSKRPGNQPLKLYIHTYIAAQAKEPIFSITGVCLLLLINKNKVAVCLISNQYHKLGTRYCDLFSS